MHAEGPCGKLEYFIIEGIGYPHVCVYLTASGNRSLHKKSVTEGNILTNCSRCHFHRVIPVGSPDLIPYWLLLFLI